MAIDKDSIKKKNAKKVYQKSKDKANVKNSSDIFLNKSGSMTVNSNDGKSHGFERYKINRKKKFRKALINAEKFKHIQDGSNEDTAYETIEVYKGTAQTALKYPLKCGKAIISYEPKNENSTVKKLDNISKKGNMLSFNTSSASKRKSGKKPKNQQKKYRYNKHWKHIYNAKRKNSKRAEKLKRSSVIRIQKKVAAGIAKCTAAVISFLISNWMIILPIILVIAVCAGSEAYYQSNEFIEYTYPASEADITKVIAYWQSLQIAIKDKHQKVPEMEGIAGRFDEKTSSVCSFMEDNNALLSFLSAYYDSWIFETTRDLLDEIFGEMYVISYSIKPENKIITETKTIPESELPEPLPSTYTILSHNGGNYVVKISESKNVNVLEYNITEGKSLEDILNEYLNAEQREKYQSFYEHKGGAVKAFSSPFAFDWSGYISSPFGYRDWGDGSAEFHKGVDFGVPHGTEELSVADGTVVKICNSCTHDYSKNSSCGCGGGYGNYVDILTDDGKYYITYGHMSAVYVNVGDKIKNGQVVGLAGCTGWSTGNHLHLEMRLGNEYGELIDPLTFIQPYTPVENITESKNLSSQEMCLDFRA